MSRASYRHIRAKWWNRFWSKVAIVVAAFGLLAIGIAIGVTYVSVRMVAG